MEDKIFTEWNPRGAVIPKNALIAYREGERPETLENIIKAAEKRGADRMINVLQQEIQKEGFIELRLKESYDFLWQAWQQQTEKEKS